jgi:hypothetical protein
LQNFRPNCDCPEFTVGDISEAVCDGAVPDDGVAFAVAFVHVAVDRVVAEAEPAADKPKRLFVCIRVTTIWCRIDTLGK